MSQRNPLNERYQNNKPEGKTRKSAASAKPASKAASSVRMESSKPAKKKVKEERPTNNAPKVEIDRKGKEAKQAEKADRKRDRVRRRAISSFVPDSEEFKRLNRKRMIYSGIGFALMVVAIIISLTIPQEMFLSIGTMIVAWVFFFIGVRIDTKQLRPLRQRGYERFERKQMKKQKHNK